MTVLIEGKMLAGYQKPDFTDKKTGETSKGKYTIQLMIEEKLSNNEIKSELYDVSIPKELISKYKDKVGQDVQVKCNYIAKDKVTFYGVL